MNAHTPEPGPLIPCAPFDDLDLEKPEDEWEWDRRVMALARARIAAERVRLERLGMIGQDGAAIPPHLTDPSEGVARPIAQTWYSRPRDRPVASG